MNAREMNDTGLSNTMSVSSPDEIVSAPQPPQVLLSVPHSGCYTYPSTRHCDRVAKRAGLLLSEHLSKLGVDNKLLTTNVRRSDMDMNRPKARKTNFRVGLTQALEDLKEVPRSIHLDVHSYPPKSLTSSDATYESRVHSLYLLDDAGETAYTRSLRDYLIESLGIPYNTYAGTKPCENWDTCPHLNIHNDIQDQARSLGIPSILLEVNELISKKKMDTVMKTVAVWVRKYIKRS